MLGEQSQTAPRGFGSRRLMALKRMVVERASVLQRPRLDGGGPRSASYVRTKYVTIPNRIVYSRTNQVLIDGGLVATALCIAYLFRFDGELPFSIKRQLLQVLPFFVALSLCVNGITGVYRSIWRFFSLRDSAIVAQSVLLAFLLSLGWRILSPNVTTAVPFRSASSSCIRSSPSRPWSAAGWRDGSSTRAR